MLYVNVNYNCDILNIKLYNNFHNQNRHKLIWKFGKPLGWWLHTQVKKWYIKESFMKRKYLWNVVWGFKVILMNK